jgi:hypothetical protein
VFFVVRGTRQSECLRRPALCKTGMATKGSSALPSPGEPVDNWKVPPFPPHNAPLDGKYVTVAPIRRDAAARRRLTSSSSLTRRGRTQPRCTTF